MDSYQYKSAMRCRCFLVVIVCVFFSMRSANVYAGDNRAENTPPVIVYSGMFNNVDYWVKLAKGIRGEVAKRQAFLLDYTHRDALEKYQTQAVQKAIVHQADAVILGPVSEQIYHALSSLGKAHIPVVLVNSDLSHPSVKSVVLTDNKQASTLAVKYLHQKIIEESNTSAKKIIIISGDKDSADARIRAETAANYLRAVDQYMVEVFYAKNWDGQAALNIAYRELEQSKEAIVGMFATFAPASIALTIAAEATNTNPVLMGFDYNIEMERLIKSKKLVGTVAQNPEEIGKASANIVFKILNQQAVKRKVYIPPFLITSNQL